MFGAYTWGFQSDTMVTVDWLHTRQNNIEDKGLPFDREGFTGPKALCDAPGNPQVGRVGNQRCGDGYATGQLPEVSVSAITSATLTTISASTWTCLAARPRACPSAITRDPAQRASATRV
ncbi:MAG: hypothetical protein U5Q16_16575 [Gammaproteobacteria bacterium]|nr:hypothetical protein [Gammaproteobacteria bacterium]